MASGAGSTSADDSEKRYAGSQATDEAEPHVRSADDRAWRFIADPAGARTHDATSVDVVTVPCPGAHPTRTWTRDGLLGRYFGAPSMRDAEVGRAPGGPAWVRQGIRREADRARILLYEHPPLNEAASLARLAGALLEELQGLRDAEGRERPCVFVCHSLGGLVVKMALVRAARETRFKGLLRQCYGVAFFGTPHQGSSYFAMSNLASSIQTLLQLSHPLPTAITDDLRVGNHLLLQLDDDFKSISTDLTVWTLYETIDSKLSGASGRDVYFTAPLTSIKSAILGMRQETILPLQSDHANLASFGRPNAHALRLFLRQLAQTVARADEYAHEDVVWTLNLEQRVSIEVHGFFEDAAGGDEAAGLTAVRAWSTRLPLREFLRKGPDECLAERLSEVDGIPEEGRFIRRRGRATGLGAEGRDHVVAPMLAAAKNALGIKQDEAHGESAPGSPVLVAAEYKPPVPPSSPLLLANLNQDVTIDRLSPPLRARAGSSPFRRSLSAGSEGEVRSFPPLSPRSRSNIESAAVSDDDDGDGEVHPLPGAVVDFGRQSPVAFVRPEAHARKFVWIHLPYNNPTWVTKVFETLQTSYKRNLSSLFNQEFWAMRHTRGRHPQHYAYYAKPGCYFTSPRPLSPRGHSHKHMSLSPIADEGVYTCLFMPYLHFDSYKRLLRRRELILERLHHGRSRPIPEAVAKSDSLELQVIWEYLGHDPPVNCRRTLDQYGYPSLRDTRSRDDDQMLYKLTKERMYLPGQQREFHGQGSNASAATGSTGSWKGRLDKEARAQAERMDPQSDILNGNILMVDQLWLWAIDSHTLLSFFPKREGDAIEGPLYQQADLRDSIFSEVNVDPTRQCENALDLAALAVLHAVSVLLDRASHPDLEVFRIFEEAISVLAEKLTLSLKNFRSEGFRDKATAYEPVENKERSIRARHKAEGRRAEQDNRDNTSALLELRDIEDELLILLNLFERQAKVVASMHATYSRPELRDRTHNARGFLAEAAKRLGDDVSRATEMLQRVRSTRDDYEKLLQMVQRQAQVDEVRLSRLHADLASAQSRSVMIFTVFTVIFLPLTFFTGLFGMNTREWGGEGNLPLRTIGIISLPASFVLLLGALVVAWSTNVRKFLRWLSRGYARALRRAYDAMLLPVARAVVGRAGSRGREQRAEEKEAKARLKKEASDFWERHRLERERGYHVPEKNKKSIVRARVNAMRGK